MLDRLPAEPRMPIEVGPVELAEAPQRRDNLLQLGQLEPEEDILELGAVEVQANPARRAGHANVRRPSGDVSPGGRSQYRAAWCRQPTPGHAHAGGAVDL